MTEHRTRRVPQRARQRRPAAASARVRARPVRRVEIWRLRHVGLRFARHDSLLERQAQHSSRRARSTLRATTRHTPARRAAVDRRTDRPSCAAAPSSTPRIAEPSRRGEGRRRSRHRDGARALRIERTERRREHADVGDGEVHSLGAGRRHDVRRVADEKQSSECCIGSATKLRIGVMPRWVIGPSLSGPSPIDGESRIQLGPDAVVAPCVDRLVRRDLDVQARDLRRPHALEREPAFVPRVHQLGRRRR